MSRGRPTRDRLHLRPYPLPERDACDNRERTIAGVIVVAPGGTENQITDEQKPVLDALHLRKIDLADRVLLVNPRRGYVGESTNREVAYAHATDKPIKFTDPL